MPRAAAATPKAMANGMKCKGLQRLRWYCQPCGKHCRDENGFRCHAMSEAHFHQIMAVPGKVVKQYSSPFHIEFMKLFSRRFGRKRVKANDVYQEYISDKNRPQMNASRWTTLTEYCCYLEKAGLVKVDMHNGVLWIEYIDRSQVALRKKAVYQNKERSHVNDEQPESKLINLQVSQTTSADAISSQQSVGIPVDSKPMNAFRFISPLSSKPSSMIPTNSRPKLKTYANKQSLLRFVLEPDPFRFL